MNDLYIGFCIGTVFGMLLLGTLFDYKKFCEAKRK